MFKCEICGKEFERNSQLNGHRNGAHGTPEGRKRISEANSKRIISDETRRKMSLASSAIPRTKEWKERISFALSKDGQNRHHKFQPESQKIKMSIKMKVLANTKEFQDKRREKLNGRTKENWEGRRRQAEKILGENNPMANPEVAMKAISRSNSKNGCSGPNKAEIRLANILSSLFPNQWKYVGDGQIIIAGKCPDFINVNGQKKIIELFGDYWHKGEDPQERIDVFKPFGYKTLVIWEKELKNKTELNKRLNDFCNI